MLSGVYLKLVRRKECFITKGIFFNLFLSDFMQFFIVNFESSFVLEGCITKLARKFLWLRKIVYLFFMVPNILNLLITNVTSYITYICFPVKWVLKSKSIFFSKTISYTCDVIFLDKWICVMCIKTLKERRHNFLMNFLCLLLQYFYE